MTQTFAAGQTLTAEAVNAELAFPTGSMIPFAGASAPAQTIGGVSAWLICDGSAVSRTTYAALFAACSTTYGAGDGSTTFNLPDLRGRVPMGAGTGSGLTARTLGGTVGTETHTLTTAQMPSHNHNVQENSGNGAILGGHFTGGGASYAGNISTTAFPVFVSNTGGGGSHPNVQPSLVTNYIIKT